MISSHTTGKIKSQASITGLGVYVPERVLSNHDLEKMVETSDEWITQRTGFRERRIAGEEQYTSDLCIEAIKDMIQRYQVTIQDVDLIIVATTTPDYPFPTVACMVQAHFGLHAGAIDISAACAGFVYGLQMANGMISAGLHKKVLVIGAETLSKVTDYTDRSTCILFGDGAGCVLVEFDEEGSFITTQCGSVGEEGHHLYRTGLRNVIEGEKMLGNGNIYQNGREIYKWAVGTLPGEISSWMEKAEMTMEDVDWFVPHSANLRMIEAICKRIPYPLEQTLFSGEFYGNTSSATIPLAMEIGIREGKIQSGDKLLLYGFGGGLVYAGALIQWKLD
ncbi:ketoacyl-ACP synthase III [Kroppenstedtia pulmonis]|uniref:Beta-ketoacyl-[acyl-carrier-protein] synthase III n=1 Tax=Kroppenstedtia pulmonis TaxID=1380685 RepID=A0A7D4BG40_9BACL|nr:ketoacyl-ACP synthase III [Kroppenstedtia pulmonis]QKG83255.1 ketoacyl-ACP synthase III [Kroppenstedtia pulmonis]